VPTTEPRSPSEHKTTCTKSSLGSNFGRAENKDHHRFLSFDNRVMTHCRSTQTSLWSLNQTRIGIKIHSETWLALASDVLPWTNPRNPPQKTKLMDLNCSTYWRNEENLRRSTSSNPQENYQNTTASSLFCKTANDQVISKSDAASVTNGWQHPTKLFKFYFDPTASHTLFRNP